MAASAVVNLIRGPVGTVVQLDVQRSGQGPLHFAITREDVAPPALSTGTVSVGTGTPIGYAHIYGFTTGMPQLLQQALQQFSQQGETSWILDLRDNSGGTLQSLVQAVSLFIPQGPIAHFQDRTGQTDELTATGQGAPLAPQKMVLLVNHDSASASEIFAAALQERAAVPVVGATTAGCVAVGKFQTLADGSAIEYAVDRVSTPVQHRVLNGAGVAPDVPVAMSLDDLASGKDPQLAAAVSVLEGQTAPAANPPASAPAATTGSTGAPGKVIPGAPTPAGP